MKKRIVCFGDSNTWGYDAVTRERFAEEKRWTGLLQKELGEGYQIVEEGLCGRTSVFEDPLNEGMSGLAYLYPCLMSHAPVDLLILMLGTNDCKQRFGLTAKNISDGMKRLVEKAKSIGAWRDQPQILIVAPGPIRKECEASEAGAEMGICSVKSYELAGYYEKLAQEQGCGFLDAGGIVTMNTIDYMHLDESSHAKLAARLAEIIQRG